MKRAARPLAAADRTLIAAVRRELRASADATKAPAMQAYMKSAMPYYGVSSPQQKDIWRRVFRAHVLQDATSWKATTLSLWRTAHFREERYAAMALTGERAYESYQTLDTLPIYEELIVTGAWWDYVDLVAGKRIGALLQSFPRDMKPLLRGGGPGGGYGGRAGAWGGGPGSVRGQGAPPRPGGGGGAGREGARAAGG